MDIQVPIEPGGAPPLSSADIRERIVSKLRHQVGKRPDHAKDRDWFVATALLVRDCVVECWFDSARRSYESGAKRVYYLSLEFLIGRVLDDAVGNLGLTEAVREALALEGVDYAALRQQEPDAALGNGGL